MLSVSLGKRRYNYKTADGKVRKSWYWQARWTDAAGKDCARSLKTQDASEARRLAVKIEEKLNAGVVPAARALDWQAVFETYRFLSATKAAVTLENEERSWKMFWEFAPVKQVHHATVVHATAWRDHMMGPGKLSIRTTNDNLVRCGTVFNKLIEKRQLTCFNPFSLVDKFRNDTPEKDWLSAAEAAKLLALAKGKGRDLHLFVALGLYAGLRPKESLNIHWDWVHWPLADGTGHIAVPVEDGDFIAKKRKARNVPLSPELRAILEFYRDGVPRAFVVAPFNQQIQKGRYRWNPRKSFDAIVAAAGFKDKNVTPYTLRHTFGARGVNAGISLYLMMDWMGHSDVRTLQIYGHVEPDNPEIGRIYAQEGK